MLLGGSGVLGEPPVGGRVQEGHDLVVIFLLAQHYRGITFVSWEDDDIIHGPRVFQDTPLNVGQVGIGKLRLFRNPSNPSSSVIGLIPVHITEIGLFVLYPPIGGY